jgi:toxin ParE1/3/4
VAGKIVWSPRAVMALEEICSYIANDSDHYACIFAQRIIAAVDELAEFPEIGRVVPEYGDRLLRERIVGHYRIVYRLRYDAVEVVLVTHGSRLLTL